MIQFVTGMSLGILQILLYKECLTIGDYYTILYHELYVGTLFFLFRKFYKDNYLKKKKKKQA